MEILVLPVFHHLALAIISHFENQTNRDTESKLSNIDLPSGFNQSLQSDITICRQFGTGACSGHSQSTHSFPVVCTREDQSSCRSQTWTANQKMNLKVDDTYFSN